MKIKEKFDCILMRNFLVRDEIEESLQQLQNVSDELSIGFTEWMSDLIHRNYKSGGFWFIKGEIKTTKELLEIFKQETGI